MKINPKKGDAADLSHTKVYKLSMLRVKNQAKPWLGPYIFFARTNFILSLTCMFSAQNLLNL
jgi:hypothetical protein